ncbi:MAG: hypothetical protein SGI77_20195 [Pirellulaceae bacterium]|nr:hypothetical protein [Pirellulaceae bacterium]
MEKLDTTRLMELAEHKLLLLTQLREISFDQNLIAESHNVDELLALLSRKNEIIESLRTLQDELKLFQSQIPEQRNWASESERVRCRELFAKSEKLIAELLVIDNQCLDTMTHQREIVSQQLEQFASAEAILEAYGGVRGYDVESSESSLMLDG